jgi:hypothetical protein
MVEAADDVIKVPAGVYPLNDSYAIGTAMSGMWVEDPSYGSYPVGCYYATLSGEYIDKLWYMVDGTITVENNNNYLLITVDATNSYGVPVNVVYNANPAFTSVENTTVENGTARKEVKNNQLFIIKDGVKYNVLGAVVK